MRDLRIGIILFWVWSMSYYWAGLYLLIYLICCLLAVGRRHVKRVQNL